MKQFLKKIKLFLKRVLDIKFSLKSLIIFILIFLGLLYLGKFLIEINIDIEKWIEKILNIINLGITCFLFFTTRSLYNYQRTTLKNENTPYPYIENIKFRFGTDSERLNITKIDNKKLNMNDIKPINEKGMPIVMWYYYGKQTVLYYDKPISEIGIELHDDNLEDKKIIKEVKDNMQSVYFTKINDHNCIVFNAIKSMDSFILEYANAEIQLKNYGALLNHLELEEITIYYNIYNSNKIISLKVTQNGQKTIPLIIQPNQTISLIYCQVTTNLIDSECVISKDALNILGREYDVLQKRMNDNILNYNKIEIIVTCENFLREKFRYKLIIEKEGGYYISKTELLNE